MNPIRSEYLISYDIEDTRKRTKLYKQLLSYGLKGVQKSVFWGWLTPAEVRGVGRYIQDSLHPRDRAFIIPVNFNKNPPSRLFGYQPEDFQDWEEYECI